MLIDMLIGMFLLVMMSMSFMTMYPILKRSQEMAEDHSKAVQVSNRMLEHLQMLRTDNLAADTLSSLNLIDDGQYSPPYSFTHVPMDEASKYSPAQALRNGTGKFAITDMPNGSKKVTMTVTWTSESGKSQQLVTGTVIGAWK